MSNGWITERCSRTGTSINPNPKKQRKGPLRKIVAVVYNGTSIFDRDKVELECGHKVRSSAMYRARCNWCLREQEKESQ